MNRFILPLVSSFIVLFLMTGCRKETGAENKALWREVSSIRDESKIILNASTDGKHLFTYGPYNVNITDQAFVTKTIIHGANSLHIPPVSSKYFGYFYEDRNLFFLTSFAAIQNGLPAAVISPSDISATAKHFNTANLLHRYLWAIGEQSQVLLSLREQDDRYGVYLITPTIVEGSGVTGPPFIIKKIAIAPLLNSPTSFYFLKNRFFFFSQENGIASLYTLDASGDIIANNPAFDGELFIYKEELYLVHGNDILLSKNGGLSFNEIFSYNQDLSEYYFRVMGDKIFVFNPRSGIGSFEFSPGGFQIRNIDINGLEGNHITQLNLFNNKLFVSTLTGLYYKDWNDVLR